MRSPICGRASEAGPSLAALAIDTGRTESEPVTALTLQPSGWKGYTAQILAWQVATSGCFYALYAVTPLVRAQFGVSTTRIGFALTALMLGTRSASRPSDASLTGTGRPECWSSG